MVKERPILMKGPLVLASMAGTKWQTRRVVRVQPASVEYYKAGQVSNAREGHPCFRDPNGQGWAACGPFKCPYGTVGDRLWVRETWAVSQGEVMMSTTETRPPGSIVNITAYKADMPDMAKPPCGRVWRPGIHMPRWASRLTLEITGIRVERVQDITEEDAIAEGIERVDLSSLDQQTQKTVDLTVSMYGGYYRGRFTALWDTINAARGYGWEANPWCWCISYKRVTPAASSPEGAE